MNSYQNILSEIRERLSSGSLKISKNTEDSFMAGEDYYKKLNMDILKSPRNLYPFESISKSDCSQNLLTLNKSEIYYCLIKEAIYIENPDSKFTIWMLLNLENSESIKLLQEISNMEKLYNIRFGLIITSTYNEERSTNLADFLIKESGDSSITPKRLKEIIKDFSNGVKIEITGRINTVRKNHQIYKNYFHIYDNKDYIISLNKKFGPLSEDYTFTETDFEIISKMYQTSFKPMEDNYLSEMIEKARDKLPFEMKKTDFTDMIYSILANKISQDSYHVDDDIENFPQFMFEVSPKKSDPYIQMDVLINPMSDDSPKMVSFLKLITETFNVKLRILLNLDDYYIKPISNRYYRYVFEPSIRFKGDKIDESMNTAMFDSLPHNALFTFHSDTLQSWFVKSKFSNCDMDNINLEEREIGCIGIYELEYLIIEGHGYDSRKGQPASGLQLILGSISKPDIFDTIVMHNLGYFQFKGYPGAFFIKLKGESEESFQIHRIVSLTTGSEDVVTMDNFMGQLIKLNVIPKETNIDEDERPKNWWDSVSGLFGNKKSSDQNENQINVFTVATGLLYERFIRIMILSVLKHTKNPVKFWFLKNYLSFQFTESIDLLSLKFNFTYEFVQYQWPHFLMKQTEKQRIIWGYKILFLDVLFPLDIKKIIFVDADQIVRADLNELLKIDLEDAPYGYTPFCDDRKEMDKFRFWKTGYWRDHLRGKPYHISALYVVDLVKFRQMNAGDRLRGQYQMLSRDPNSLANLDQDLPNNIQDMVPIKSLPIEWLWCETWCSDKSKEKAKTIDMCNNPLTHEAKLDRAKRIAPEWTKYDEIINEVIDVEFASDKISRDEL